MAATPEDAAGAVLDADGGVCLPAALRTTLQLGSTAKLSEAGPSWLLISGLQLLGLSVAEGGSIRGFYMSLAVAPEGASAATRPLLRDEDPNTAVLAWKDRLVLEAPLQDPQCTLTLQVLNAREKDKERRVVARFSTPTAQLCRGLEGGDRVLVSEDGEVRLRVVVTVSRHHEGALAWKNQHTPREEGSVVCLPVLGEGGGACRCVRLFHAYATNDSAAAPKAAPEESEEDSKGPYLSKTALARLLVEHVEGYANIHSGVGSLSKAPVCAKAAHALLHLRDHDPSQDTQRYVSLEELLSWWPALTSTGPVTLSSTLLPLLSLSHSQALRQAQLEDTQDVMHRSTRLLEELSCQFSSSASCPALLNGGPPKPTLDLPPHRTGLSRQEQSSAVWCETPSLWHQQLTYLQSQQDAIDKCVVVVEGSVEGCKALMDYVATLHTDTQALRQAMRSVTDSALQGMCEGGKAPQLMAAALGVTRSLASLSSRCTASARTLRYQRMRQRPSPKQQSPRVVGGVPVPAAAVLAPAPLLASVSAPILSPVKTVKTVPPAAAALPSPQHPHKRVSGQWGRYVHYRLEQVTQALEQAPDLATTIDLQALSCVLEHTLQHPPANGAWLQPLNRLSVRLWEATGEAVVSSVDDPFAAWTRLQTYKGSDLKGGEVAVRGLLEQHMGPKHDATRLVVAGVLHLAIAQVEARASSSPVPPLVPLVSIDQLLAHGLCLLGKGTLPLPQSLAAVALALGTPRLGQGLSKDTALLALYCLAGPEAPATPNDTDPTTTKTHRHIQVLDLLEAIRRRRARLQALTTNKDTHTPAAAQAHITLPRQVLEGKDVPNVPQELQVLFRACALQDPALIDQVLASDGSLERGRFGSQGWSVGHFGASRGEVLLLERLMCKWPRTNKIKDYRGRVASDCTSNVACLRALGYLRPQASTAALETWQQEPSSTLGMSKSLSASTSISLSKSKATLGRTRPVATPQVCVEVEVRGEGKAWARGTASAYDMSNKTLHVTLTNTQTPQVVHVDEVRVVRALDASSQWLATLLQDYHTTRRQQCLHSMATGVVEGALAQARGTVGGALAQGYSHALERVIEEAVGEEGRAVARQGMWEGHVDMLLPSVWAEAVEGPGVGEACVVVARETLEGQRKEWALACSTTQHVMQQLLDAILHTNNAQGMIDGPFRSQASLTLPQAVGVGVVGCEVEVGATGTRYTIQAAPLLDWEAELDLEDDDVAASINNTLLQQFGVGLDECLRQLTEEELEHIEDGPRTLHALARVIAAHQQGEHATTAHTEQLQARVHETLQECVPTWHSVTAFHLNAATAPSLLVQHAHPVHGALVTTPLTMYKRQYGFSPGGVGTLRGLLPVLCEALSSELCGLQWLLPEGQEDGLAQWRSGTRLVMRQEGQHWEAQGPIDGTVTVRGQSGACLSLHHIALLNPPKPIAPPAPAPAPVPAPAPIEPEAEAIAVPAKQEVAASSGVLSSLQQHEGSYSATCRVWLLGDETTDDDDVALGCTIEGDTECTTFLVTAPGAKEWLMAGGEAGEGEHWALAVVSVGPQGLLGLSLVQEDGTQQEVRAQDVQGLSGGLRLVVEVLASLHVPLALDGASEDGAKVVVRMEGLRLALTDVQLHDPEEDSEDGSDEGREGADEGAVLDVMGDTDLLVSTGPLEGEGKAEGEAAEGKDEKEGDSGMGEALSGGDEATRPADDEEEEALPLHIEKAHSSSRSLKPSASASSLPAASTPQLAPLSSAPLSSPSPQLQGEPHHDSQSIEAPSLQDQASQAHGADRQQLPALLVSTATPSPAPLLVPGAVPDPKMQGRSPLAPLIRLQPASSPTPPQPAKEEAQQQPHPKTKEPSPPSPAVPSAAVSEPVASLDGVEALSVGQACECRYGHTTTFYPCTIRAAASPMGPFHVRYDDGEEEEGVHRLRLRLAGQKQSRVLSAGERVEARVGAELLPGKVVALDPEQGPDVYVVTVHGESHVLHRKSLLAAWRWPPQAQAPSTAIGPLLQQKQLEQPPPSEGPRRASSGQDPSATSGAPAMTAVVGVEKPQATKQGEGEPKGQEAANLPSSPKPLAQLMPQQASRPSASPLQPITVSRPPQVEMASSVSTEAASGETSASQGEAPSRATATPLEAAPSRASRPSTSFDASGAVPDPKMQGRSPLAPLTRLQPASSPTPPQQGKEEAQQQPHPKTKEPSPPSPAVPSAAVSEPVASLDGVEALSVGQACECRYGHTTTFYPCTIRAAASPMGPFHVRYDDGEEEEGVHRLRLRLAGQKQSRVLSAGERVEARVGAELLPGKVVALDPEQGPDVYVVTVHGESHVLHRKSLLAAWRWPPQAQAPSAATASLPQQPQPTPSEGPRRASSGQDPSAASGAPAMTAMVEGEKPQATKQGKQRPESQEQAPVVTSQPLPKPTLQDAAPPSGSPIQPAAGTSEADAVMLPSGWVDPSAVLEVMEGQGSAPPIKCRVTVEEGTTTITITADECLGRLAAGQGHDKLKLEEADDAAVARLDVMLRKRYGVSALDALGRLEEELAADGSTGQEDDSATLQALVHSVQRLANKQIETQVLTREICAALGPPLPWSELCMRIKDQQLQSCTRLPPSSSPPHPLETRLTALAIRLDVAKVLTWARTRSQSSAKAAGVEGQGCMLSVGHVMAVGEGDKPSHVLTAQNGADHSVKVTIRALAGIASSGAGDVVLHTSINAQQDSQAPTQTTSQDQVPVGTKVECRYGDGPQFFPGRIKAVDAFGLHHVLYDDGDDEKGVNRIRLRLAGQKQARLLTPGEQVEARCEAAGDLVRPGTVLAVADPQANTYTITFHDKALGQAQVPRPYIFAMWTSPPANQNR